ncbi:hypothetical protein C8R44DRAFT_148235 [Mycena epipterygia]|nr:hypothetical protein C8R44DRAFT_148235 [Mycena epipterygia]
MDAFLDERVFEAVVGDLESIDLLPFANGDPCGEFGERPCMRDRATINAVAVQCWKALRIPETPTKRLDRLSLFPCVHIDLLLEVLGHLHPIDLMHVARATRAFRELLHAPISAAVWRSAFVGRAPLPSCPPDIPGRRWAKLLFGPSQCDECEAPNTSPDYIIRRRLCVQCMNLRLLYGVPGYPPSHVVHTLVAMGSHGIWPADGIAVAEEYERLKAASASNTPPKEDGSPSALDAFIETRKKVVQATLDLADDCVRWSRRICAESQWEMEKRLRRIVKSARKRLVREGYDPRDVGTGPDLWHPVLDYTSRLTCNKARAQILPLVLTAQTARLARERGDLIIARLSAVAAATAPYILQTAPAVTWPYYPQFDSIVTFRPLHDLIHDPSDSPLAETDERLAEALEGLPAFVETWKAERRAMLTSLLPSSSPSDKADVRRLELATSVFSCSCAVPRSLIGWDGAGVHVRCPRHEFAPYGAAAARELVRLVGLDPETTTAAEMDRLCGNGRVGDQERRFLCALCPVIRYKRMRGRWAMRWRECVLHTMERTHPSSGDAGHRKPVWMLLTDPAAADVQRRETPDPVAQDLAWVCALCPPDIWRRQKVHVVEHVQTKHAIQNPIEGQHFIYYVGEKHKPRQPALLSQERDVADLRCNRCPPGKLWSRRAIGRHVADKHNVVAPGESDWTPVEQILRTTPVVDEANRSLMSEELAFIDAHL